MEFKQAERKNAKLRLALAGVSGGGKSLSGLILAFLLGGEVGAIDSEHGSLSLYTGYPGVGPFKVLELETHTIQSYLAAIESAAAAGITTLLIDSYSHAWMHAMEMIDRGGGWAKAGKMVTPLINQLVKAISTYPGHVIVTMRSKMDYAIEKDERTGKVTGMRKLGAGPVARPDSEYEFTMMLELTREGAITVSKSRCGNSVPIDTIYDRSIDLPKIAKALNTWLSEGSPVSARDALAEQIAFARSNEALDALKPAMLALRATDPAAFQTLRAPLAARRQEFAE